LAALFGHRIIELLNSQTTPLMTITLPVLPVR